MVYLLPSTKYYRDMTGMGSTTLQIALAVIFVIATAYAAGRVHQWYRHTFERDVAYREGYNQASRTLFHLAARNPSAKSEQLITPSAAPTSVPIREVAPFHPLGSQRSTSDRV
jgi:hypothetical protein